MNRKKDEKGAVRLIRNSTAEFLIFTGQAGQNYERSNQIFKFMQMNKDGSNKQIINFDEFGVMNELIDLSKLAQWS